MSVIPAKKHRDTAGPWKRAHFRGADVVFTNDMQALSISQLCQGDDRPWDQHHPQRQALPTRGRRHAFEDVREGAGNRSVFGILNVCKCVALTIAPAAARSEGMVTLARP
ncbi:hypothetical protein Daus18300_008572 [Diaporthe australafricana]|uniref:Uncharacterized protein n=1 Tax=Diaporthe australafricana TaxID=127596 RepID=A0ABR3WI01_9PEZI